YQHARGSRSRRISHGESRFMRRPLGAALAADGTNKGIIGMDHRIVWARPLGRALTVTAAAAGFLGAAALFIAPVAFAQAPAQQPAKPAAKPAAPKPPAAAQPAPAQPAPQAPQQQQAGDQPQLMYSPWTRICDKSAETNNKQICIIGKDGRLETGQPVVVTQIIEPEGAPRKIRVIVPIPVMVQNGTRIMIDDQELAQAPYAVCSPQMGCAAEYNCDDATVGKLKKGKQIVVQVINVYNAVVSLPLPLSDFAKAFDGPPIDPKA